MFSGVRSVEGGVQAKRRSRSLLGSACSFAALPNSLSGVEAFMQSVEGMGVDLAADVPARWSCFDQHGKACL